MIPSSSPIEAAHAADSRPPIEHELKTWQSYFHVLVDGSKNFELRRNDRGFRSGDTLWLRETDYATGAYTGREMRRKITYVLQLEEDLGLRDGFAILSLEPLHAAEVAALREALTAIAIINDGASFSEWYCRLCGSRANSKDDIEHSATCSLSLTPSAAAERVKRMERVIEAATKYRAAEQDGTPRIVRGKSLHDLASNLDAALVALSQEPGDDK